MSTLMGSLLRKATKKPGERFNILTCPTHERYESGLCKCNADFYAYRGEGIKDWDSAYAEKPNNYHLLPANVGLSALPIDVEFDAVLSQNKFGQYPVLKDIAHILHLPLICLEHTLPYAAWSKRRLEHMKLMRGEINIFISEYSRDKWGWQPNEAGVIHHGVDTELFSPGQSLVEKPKILSVVNDFINRDEPCGYKLWEETTKGLHESRVILGKTPGLSEPAANINALVQAYRDCRVFLNTSLVSPVPTVVLEAMACGKPVVSTNNCMLPEIIEHGKNGLLANTAEELRYYITTLLMNEPLAEELGGRARETILQRFSMNSFVQNWNWVFEKATKISYKGA